MSTEAAESPAPRRWPVTRVLVVWGVVAALWLLLDQVTKVLAVALLEDNGRVVDLGIIQLRAIRNPGGAFGLPGLPGLFVAVSAVVLFLVLRALPKTDRLDLAVAYGLVTGGAVGNLIDRLFRVPGFPSGAVVDFLDLRWWPVFNIADAGIVIGAIAIAVLMTRAERHTEAAESAGVPTAEPGSANPRR
jgi:signal peptidase II